LPLTRTTFLRHDLGLDATSAQSLSPVNLTCYNRAPLILAVGALESAGFHQQAAQLAAAWGPELVPMVMDVPECDHLAVCDVFAQSGGSLFEATRALLQAPEDHDHSAGQFTVLQR
jgi:arylformamidase